MLSNSITKQIIAD